jgi:hypothetical protein
MNVVMKESIYLQPGSVAELEWDLSRAGVRVGIRTTDFTPGNRLQRQRRSRTLSRGRACERKAGALYMVMDERRDG